MEEVCKRRNGQESENSDGIEKIPDEILVEHIFMILPASSVMAVRSVCKGWRSLTTGPSFVQDHTRNRRHCSNPKSLIVQIESSPFSEFCRVDADIYGNQISEGRVEIQVPPNCNKGNDHGFHMRASCDGLLCFESKHSKSYYICNPVTKTWTIVAAYSPNHYNCSTTLCGLYFHHPTQEYRLLQYFIKDDTYNPNVMHVGYKVATVNGPQWRTIYERTFPGGLHEFRKGTPKLDIALAMRLYSRYAATMTTNGNLHWLHNDKLYLGIIVFNTDAEEFSEMNIPSECMHLWPDVKLNVIGEHLCLGLQKDPINDGIIEMEIWVLRDYTLQQWTKLQRVVHELGSIQTLPYKENEEFKMLVKWRSRIFLYDLWRTTSCHLHIPQVTWMSDSIGYTESLIML